MPSAAYQPLVPAAPHLSQGGLLVPQPHDEDAVGLSDAALGPGGHGEVRLVQDDPVDVLLLRQPAGQTVLVDAGREEGRDVRGIAPWVLIRAEPFGGSNPIAIISTNVSIAI